MHEKTLKRSFFQRLFGKPATQPPKDKECWTFTDGKVIVDLSRAPELSETGGAIRLEGNEIPERVLVIHGDDGNYYAFSNKCKHGGRRLDPVPCAGTVQCCSIGKSTYDYSGKVLSGSAKEDIIIYPVKFDDGKLIIEIK